MSRKKKASSGPVTPEQIIRSRLRRLADWDEVTSFITKFVWMVILIGVLFGVLFGVTTVKNNDMSPRMSSGDVLLYYRLEDNLKAQDVIVFEKDGRQYVGRVVAKGGEVVEVTDDAHLKINNSTVVETDIFYKTPKYGDEVSYPLTLEDDEYFILCDFRDGAKDSRYFGPVSQKEIKGKALMVIRRSSL